MLNKILGLLILLIFPLSNSSAYSQGSTSTSEVLNKLKDLAGVKSVQQAANRARPGGAAPSESYAIMFEQPVDHQQPDGAKFQLRVFVTHTGYDKPVVLNTEGYAAMGPGGSGDLDAWSATQMQLLGRTNSLKIVVEGQHHGARVSSFSPAQKELFYSNLEKWLDMKLTRQ